MFFGKKDTLNIQIPWFCFILRQNCYADLEKILKHFGCTFDDVVKEDIFTTDMAQMLEKSAYRAEIYKNGFPTGSWLEVKGLALPEFMVEIELEVHKSE